MTRWLLVMVGSVAVALGFIGTVVPVLPTTPFLLLAAICYGRSSQRLHDWLLYNRCFGEYIRNYREGKGVAVRHKVAALTLLWGTIGYSAGFAVEKTWVRLLLLGIAVAVTAHLLWIRTFRKNEQSRQSGSEAIEV